MIGYVTLYKSVLHSDEITLPLWFFRSNCSLVSILNSCEYSLTHHWNNAVRLIDNAQRVEVIHDALRSQSFENTFKEKEIAILHYSKKLTCDVENLKKLMLSN